MKTLQIYTEIKYTWEKNNYLTIQKVNINQFNYKNV